MFPKYLGRGRYRYYRGRGGRRGPRSDSQGQDSGKVSKNISNT